MHLIFHSSLLVACLSVVNIWLFLSKRILFLEKNRLKCCFVTKLENYYYGFISQEIRSSLIFILMKWILDLGEEPLYKKCESSFVILCSKRKKRGKKAMAFSKSSWIAQRTDVLYWDCRSDVIVFKICEIVLNKCYLHR